MKRSLLCFVGLSIAIPALLISLVGLTLNGVAVLMLSAAERITGDDS